MKAQNQMFRASLVTNNVTPFPSVEGTSTFPLWATKRTEVEAWQWLISAHNNAYQSFTEQAQEALEKREIAMRGLAQAVKNTPPVHAGARDQNMGTSEKDAGGSSLPDRMAMEKAVTK